MNYSRPLLSASSALLAPAALAADVASVPGDPQWWAWGTLLVLALAVAILGALFALPGTREDEMHDASLFDSGDAHWVRDRRKAMREAGDGAPPSQPYRGQRILVAEDNLTSQLVLRRMLENLGFEVDTVSNGRLAVERFRQYPYAAILMDIRMPVMDGLSATREIRQNQRGRNTPIIGITADTLRLDKGLCLESGMDDYLEKPVRRLPLVRTLARWIEVGKEIEAEQGADRPALTNKAFSTRFMELMRDQVAEVEPRTIRLVADSYLSECRTQLDRINQALPQRDLEAITAAVLVIGSTSREIGAYEMTSLAEALEVAARAAAMEKAGQILRRMRHEQERITHAFDQMSTPSEQESHTA